MDVLKENGIISRNDLVKILGKGELKNKVNISAHKFSASAKSAIEANGGICTEI
jgi:large subunit ribosomal protein L15